MIKKLIFSFSFIFFLMLLLFTLYFNYFEYMKMQNVMSNSLISEKAMSFIFNNESTPSLDKLSKIINEDSDTIIISEIYNNKYDLNILGVYGSDNYFNEKLSILEFEKFSDEKLGVIVSKKILSSKYSIFEDGAYFFDFINNKYRIDGVISTDINSMIDNIVFFSLNYIDITQLYKFTIDGKNTKNIETVINQIREKYDIRIIKNSNNFISKFLFNDKDMRILTNFIVLFMLLLVVLLSIIVLNFYKEEINIKRVIGVNNRRILIDLYKSTIKLIVVNVFLFVLFDKIVLERYFLQYFMNFYNWLCMFVFIITIVIFFVIYMYINISNIFFNRNGVR